MGYKSVWIISFGKRHETMAKTFCFVWCTSVGSVLTVLKLNIKNIPNTQQAHH